MVLAKQTYRLTDTSDPNTIEDEINAAIEEQEKELQEAIDQAQEAVDKSDQITADLEETNNKIDNVKIEIDTNIGETNSKVDELQTTIKNNEGKITEVTQTVQGIQTTVSNQDGRITTLKQTVDGMKLTVQNNSNQITSVSQSVDGVLVKIEDNKQKIGQLTITSQNLQSNITNLENNTNSKISQLSGNINLRVEKDKVINQINISEEGILIDGSKVKITGETYIENGVIKDAMIQSLKVDKITGNKASFVQAAFSDANSSTTINSRGILTKDRNNNTVGLNNGGLEMRDRSGNLVFKAVTRDWLDANGYDDTALLAALGRRQLTIGLAYNDGNEDNITPVISFKRREYDVGSSKKYYDSMYIEHQDRFRLVTTNYYRAQICDSINAQNGNTYFSILSDSGKCGILWGDSQMYVKVEERCYSVKDILRRCNLL